MNEQQKEQLRQILLERYGLDINEANCRFSTQNHAFIFPGQPHMIRVNMAQRSSEQILGELMWLEDLNAEHATVCEPSPSLQGNLLEEFVLDGKICRASMFRTARGTPITVPRMDRMFFVCAGNLLGKIHSTSEKQNKIGKQYRRPMQPENFSGLKKSVYASLTPELQARIDEIEQRVFALERDAEHFGLCHCDFHLNNFFVENNNIWLYDFDGCSYGYYLYDIAIFVMACISNGYRMGEDCVQTVRQYILPYFMMGYELEKNCDPHYWDHVELFMTYRACFSYMMLCRMGENAPEVVVRWRKFYAHVLQQEDILSALSEASRLYLQNK